jgi:S-adenosylmethionine/arginine decarboxylase-like enzyme
LFLLALSRTNALYGPTMIYLLDESHLSTHAFVAEGKITIDVSTGSLGVGNDKVNNIIKAYFEKHAFNIDAYYFTQGNKLL